MGRLTVAVGNVQLVSDRLKSSTTATFTIVYAFPIINISLHALTAEIRAINIIVMNQMIAALATFQKRINILSELIDIWERNKVESPSVDVEL